MSLTMASDLLAGQPAPANYRIDGPEHRLFFDDFPRRVRADFVDATVFDTRQGKLLHEAGLLPQLYVPREDVRLDLLQPTDHTSHCPFKGDAAYWSIAVGGRTAENAAWAYPYPNRAAPRLRRYIAFYWDPMDTWYDEDEKVEGHLRDPYHRADVRDATRHVRVTAAGETIAETRHPKILSETGLPNRFYIPPEDVRHELLEPSDTHTICPYKGTASYCSVRVNNQQIADAAWCYPEPLEDALKVRGHFCFLADGVTAVIEGIEVRT